MGIAGLLFWAGLMVSVGWGLGRRYEKRRVAQNEENARLARRNKLRDNGRTTDRRPEHDDEPPSSVGRIRVVGANPSAGDKPPTRRF